MGFDAFITPDPLTAGKMVALLATAAASGAASGAVGIGGVFLMPVLLVLGADAQTAAVSTLASFFLESAVAAAVYWRRGQIPAREALHLGAGVACGALVGALLLPVVPSVVLGLVVSSVALLSGMQLLHKQWTAWRSEKGRGAESNALESDSTELVQQAQAGVDPAKSDSVDVGTAAVSVEDVVDVALESDAETPAHPKLALTGQQRLQLSILGVFAGAGSVLSATGGPLILVPTMLLLFPSLPTSSVVGLSIGAAVLVSGTSATVSFASPDVTVDVGLAATMGAALACGVPIGIRAAGRVSSDRLKFVISLLLVGVGLYSIIKVLESHSSEE